MYKFKFSYDKENDDLFIFNPKAKSSGSVELGNLVLDFDKNKNLVGIQIEDASAVISDLVAGKREETRDLLEHLEACKVEIITRKNLIIVRMILIGQHAEIPATISVPSIVSPSPALTYS